MESKGWKLAEWYAAAFVAGAMVGGIGLFVPQGGWFEFDSSRWMGIDALLALLLVGVHRHVERARPLRFYGSFGLLAGASFAGLVPLTNPLLSAFEWILAALLIAMASGVVMLGAFGLANSLFAGRLPRSVIVAALALALSSTGLGLFDLLDQFPGSLVLVGCLIVLLAVLNGYAIQNWMGWGRMNERGNTVMAWATMVAVGLVGVAVLYEVLP